ncbi:MAG: malto-oligosyltrehalose synthase, partial [Betaproteobacteria bacterium]|nr:malto-oligosyltrehalose synthase [Betaproteobacteria bacterium]
LIATSTHDTKRSEDVRARLAALSELPSLWRLALLRWRVANRGARGEVNGAPAPSAKDEYLYYQTLLGIWPDGGGEVKEVKKRVSAYMLKAVREAKERTSWINPDAEYEQALERFIDASLENKVFLKELDALAAHLSRLGKLVSLSQAAIKVASPGVPDYYQGTEAWDLSLVDPDNRRAVDYRARRSLLESEFRGEDLAKWLRSGAAKLQVIRKGLALRKDFRELFHAPAYAPLYADAGMDEKVCEFALSAGLDRVVAVAPRLFAALLPENAPMIPVSAWGTSTLAVPEGEYENVLTGEKLRSGGALAIADLLRRFPVALLRSLR